MLRAILAAAALLAPLAATPAAAQQSPPHAWLFGEWTGGLFPVPANISKEACLAQPTVVFTRDLAMRVTLTDTAMTQREVETARAVPGGFELRFINGASGSSYLGNYAQPPGFGCETTDVLHIQRRGENEIAFPGCADFPNPLVRCH